MNIFDLLFGWGGQAMQLTFQYGFILKEEDFLELTDEQYVQFHIKMGECNERIFMIAPADPRNAIEADSTDLPIVTESQKDAFLEAAKDIEKYAKERISIRMRRSYGLRRDICQIYSPKAPNMRNTLNSQSPSDRKASR